MQKRSRKRARLMFAYIGIFSIFFASLFLLFKASPTCSDGKRNQGEVEVDCGGPCKPCTEKIVLEPIEISDYEWVYSFEDKYDFVASLKNPNNKYGASKFKYRVVIQTQEGEEPILTKWVSSFALPGERKILLLQGIELENPPTSIKMELDTKEVEWEKYTDFEGPDFIINEKHYQELGGGDTNFSRAWGTVINRGSVDFEEVFVKVFLRDSDGKLLATNSDLLGGFRAGARRDFNMLFPARFEGEVDSSDIDIEIETNPFNDENLSKVYGKDDEWDTVR